MIYIRKIHYKLSLLFVCAGFSSLFGQQASLSSLAYLDQFRTIPAYAGMEGTMIASAIYRNQWQNLDLHPQFIDLAVHFPVYKWGASSGLLFGQDRLGLEKHSYLRPGIFKVFKFKNMLISTGLEAQLDWLNFDGFSARTPDGEYTSGGIDHKDRSLDIQSQTRTFFDAGASALLLWDKFQFGIAAEKLLQTGGVSDRFPWKNKRNFKFLLAYEFDWWELDFHSEILVLSELVHVQTNFLLAADYKGSVFGGVQLKGYSGNSLESLGLFLGFSLTSNISLAYCHEFYVGRIPGNKLASGQEIGLFYNFGKAFGLGKPPRIIHSPRYSD